ncbi:MAG: AzlC family ABC transporter permease [Synergistaceae bacterium]|jgi:4-azaleucine resistance transporter AzlC|nr:AzlC family ABC transporter permease [Synergistaceae bacterium]
MKAASVKKGMRGALPIILGGVPIGMAHGLLTRQMGFAIELPLFLSLFVFAGSSQFIAVSMLQAGAAPLAVIGTTFVVNFRHLLMSASIAPRLKSWTFLQRFLMGCTLTDETFAVHSANFAAGGADTTEALSLNFTLYLMWTLSVVSGFQMGNLIERPEVWGLDFALPAMFLGLLLPICTRRPAVAAALCGGAVSLSLHRLGFGSWAAFTGALAGATAGAFVADGNPKKEAKPVE